MLKRSLVGLVVSVVALSLAVFGVAGSYSHWRQEYRQPGSQGGGYSFKQDRVFQHIGCTVWKTGSGELFYAISAGYADFEPIIPTLSFSISYNIHEGGELVVNGSTIEYTAAKRLLALDPFGEMQEIVLTEPEAEIVASGHAEAIWNDIVLEHFYRLEGEAIDGKHIGHWQCSDPTGRKAYEGEYIDGKRDGRWVYFYPSGAIRVEAAYAYGKRHGRWRYFLEDGTQTDFLTWDNDFPVERPASQTGLWHADVLFPNGNSQHSSG